MISRRYLCSHLVTLQCGAHHLMVNLEEIWETGAVLEAEEPPSTTAPAELRCGEVMFCGSLMHIEEHAFGWRVEMTFSPLTPWSPSLFRPEHMLDPSQIG